VGTNINNALVEPLKL